MNSKKALQILDENLKDNQLFDEAIKADDRSKAIYLIQKILADLSKNHESS